MVEALGVRLVNLLIMQLYKQQFQDLCGQHGDCKTASNVLETLWKIVQGWIPVQKENFRFSRKFLFHHRKEKQMGFNSFKFAAAFPLLSRKGLRSLGPVVMECQQLHLTSRTLGNCKEFNYQILLSQAYLIKWILLILTKAAPNCRLSVSRSTYEKIISGIRNGCLNCPDEQGSHCNGTWRQILSIIAMSIFTVAYNMLFCMPACSPCTLEMQGSQE